VRVFLLSELNFVAYGNSTLRFSEPRGCNLLCNKLEGECFVFLMIMYSIGMLVSRLDDMIN